MSNYEMIPPVLLFGPSRLVRELRAFCVPELLSHWCREAQQATKGASAAVQTDSPPSLLPLAPQVVAHPVPGGLLVQLGLSAHSDEQLLAATSQHCTLLSAALRPLAAAASLEAAAAAALEHLPPGTAQRHPLRAVCLDGGSARAPAERALRQQLQRLGLGSAPEPAAPPLWCIQHCAGWPLGGATAPHHEEVAPHFLLGLQLAVGASLPAARSRQLGPTAMLPELAALSSSLAAVHAGCTVLDPFCGSGSLLAAAADAGAALVVGSDIDTTHFASGGSSGTGGAGNSKQRGGGLPVAPVLLQADVACLQQLLPPTSVDAIVTDLPYGYRTEVTVGAAAAAVTAALAAKPGAAGSTAGGGPAQAAGQEGESWQRLLAVLLRLASHVLVPGGRLLVWMPLQQDACRSDSTHSGAVLQPSGAAATLEWQRRQLEEQGLPHGLCLLHLLPETRQGGYPRAAVLFELRGGSRDAGSAARASDPGSRSQQLLAALEAAAAGGHRVLNLPARGHQEQEEQAADRQQAASGAAVAGPAESAPPAHGGPSPAPLQPAAVEQRRLHYKHVRGACKGAAIDVWRAAWLGDTAAIAEYSGAGGDVDARDRKGQAALQFAAGYGREAAVALLLQLGADPAAAGDRSGMAALHRAAARNHVGTLAALLAAGADPRQRSAVGQTPLHYASQFGHEPAVRLLLVQLGSAEQEAGGSGADGGAVAPRALHAQLALCDAAGLSALHLAAQWGMADVARLLLEAGADPDQLSTCEQRLTPAHLAARWGHAPVLKVLQRHGGDLRQPCGGRRWTPMDEAREWRRQGCIDLLQELEAN